VLLGLSVLRAQVWRTEESLWREAVERAPGKVRPKIQLARVAQLAEARQLLEEAKRLAPEDPLVASELGRMYLVSGSPEKALSEFGRALALLPNNPQALTNRGVALLLLKQPDAARQDFENALARNPCLFEARLNLQRMGVATVIPPDCRYADAEQRALTAGK
jgi:Putative Zn-dependent protease, contains TPR repeats